MHHQATMAAPFQEHPVDSSNTSTQLAVSIPAGTCLASNAKLAHAQLQLTLTLCLSRSFHGAFMAFSASQIADSAIGQPHQRGLHIPETCANAEPLSTQLSKRSFPSPFPFWEGPIISSSHFAKFLFLFFYFM
ncbi:hypothetical protein LI328DRAFT_128731 [Trichoderma asperelloides]|nr:hypothetical protein LI328DRAFT_128731 [Trichoderma asperelloides]